jgi:hypothetical protein
MWALWRKWNKFEMKGYKKGNLANATCVAGKFLAFLMRPIFVDTVVIMSSLICHGSGVEMDRILCACAEYDVRHRNVFEGPKLIALRLH